MKRLRPLLGIIIVVTSLLLGGLPDASANLGGTADGFSGRNYLKMESLVRTFYVSGFVHGMSIVPSMAEGEVIVPWLTKCVDRMSPIQFEQALTTYIKEHTMLQDARLDVLAFLALKTACRKR